jgi:ABC-type transport system involved in cytochrome bd biosynthesis fused ATPase/permease subunit
MRWAAPVSSGVTVKPVPVISVIIVLSTVVIPVAITLVIRFVLVIAPAISPSLCKNIGTDHQHTGNQQGTQAFHVRFHNPKV